MFDVPGDVKDEKFGMWKFEKEEENLESKLVCDEKREREENVYNNCLEFGLVMRMNV